MQWEFIVALVIAIPIIIFPVAFVWYLNAGGLASANRSTRAKKAAHEEKAQVVTPQTASMPRIREVQVFRKPGETGIGEAMGGASKATGAARDGRKTAR